MTYQILTKLHGNVKDLSGETFGRLTAIAPVDRTPLNQIKWLCICDCGTETVVDGGHLNDGHTASCGCLSKELSLKRSTTHGGTGCKEYRAWASMRARCTNKNTTDYKNYGDRGITICKRWDKYENFLEDMGRAPTPKHSIDRINNELGYSPENCRYATSKQQNNNRRDNRMVTANGITLTLSQWSDKTGIAYSTLRNRLLTLGWLPEQAIIP